MTDITDLEVSQDAPAGYRLGDPIALEDLLALPPDGRRYTRDAEGRLALMSPEDTRWHGYPESKLVRWFNRTLDDPWFVTFECGIAFQRIWSLQGRLLPPSRLGPKTLEPDAAIFASAPDFVDDDRSRARGFDTTLLRLIVEVLSPGTHRNDLGLGRTDQVDRPRSYLDSGVPEYWVLNTSPETLGGLPSRSGLFLGGIDGRWQPLPGDGLVHAAGTALGFAPVVSGRITSRALGLTVDLDQLWGVLLPPT